MAKYLVTSEINLLDGAGKSPDGFISPKLRFPIDNFSADNEKDLIDAVTTSLQLSFTRARRVEQTKLPIGKPLGGVVSNNEVADSSVKLGGE